MVVEVAMLVESQAGKSLPCAWGFARQALSRPNRRRKSGPGTEEILDAPGLFLRSCESNTTRIVRECLVILSTKNSTALGAHLLHHAQQTQGADQSSQAYPGHHQPLGGLFYYCARPCLAHPADHLFSEPRLKYVAGAFRVHPSRCARQWLGSGLTLVTSRSMTYVMTAPVADACRPALRF